MMRRATLGLAVATVLGASAAGAQETRTRVTVGPQVVPRFPGSEDYAIRPFFDISRARGDELFIFEAPDESTGIALYNKDGLALGPALAFEGVRRRDDLGVVLPRVGFTVEAGGFVQYQFVAPIRLRAEVRQGIGGHKGLVGSLGADYVVRDGDRWLISAGPRLTLASGRYHRAYFGVTPEGAATSGLRVYRPGGGVQAVGATVGALRQLSRRWGLQGYAKYDRLVDDPGRSPIVRGPGTRSQLSGGLALSYTFGE